MEIKRNDFRYYLRRKNGVLEHGFNWGRPGWWSGIYAPVISFVPLETGPDATTGFSGGAKKATDVDNTIVFDTADLGEGYRNISMSAAVAYSNLGTVVYPNLVGNERDVNGVVRRRLELRLITNTGAAYNFASLGEGKQFEVYMTGRMPVYE